MRVAAIAVVKVVDVIAAITLSNQLTPRENIGELESNNGASVQMSCDDPSNVDGHVPVNDMPFKEPQQLTGEEKSRIQTIIKRHEHLNKVLKQGYRRMAYVNTCSRFKKIGRAALIREIDMV